MTILLVDDKNMEIDIGQKYKWKYDFSPGAAEEFRYIMGNLGYYISIKPVRGSHGAEFWVSNKDVDDFKKNILGNPIKGWFRYFYTCEIDKSNFNFFYVSYKKQ